MQDPETIPAGANAALLRTALARWDNEGGALVGGTKPSLVEGPEDVQAASASPRARVITLGYLARALLTPGSWGR